MSRSAFFTSLAVTLLLSVSPAMSEEPPRLEPVDTIAEAVIGKDTPGLAVLVTKNGEVLHMAGYGLADMDEEIPVTPDTIFDLASVSKQMTAMAAALQIEDTLYGEETTIDRFLPAFAEQPGDDRALTVGDLVHHISGFPDYLGGEMDYGDETTNDEVVAWLAGQKLDHSPGTKYEYSNSGYLTLGSLVAAADKADSLAAVLSARIWEPLGMQRTNLVTPAGSVDASEVAKGYKGTDGKFEPSHWTTVTEGDGNVLTCLRDLALYEAALSQNTLLSARATKLLFTNGTLDDGSAIDEDGSGYGFGWHVEVDDAGQTYASHGGSWMGTATYYQRNLTTGVTVIVLANGEDAGTVSLAGEIEAALEE